MAQQTAVSWLDERLQDKMFIQYGYGTRIRKIVIPIDYYMEFIKQALVMEKEQRIKDYNTGFTDAQCNHVNDAENLAADLEYLQSIDPEVKGWIITPFGTPEKL